MRRLLRPALLALPALVCAALLAAAPAAAAGPRDARELEAFLDGLVGGLMRERHVPGAVICVVRNGDVFFRKGWGVADLESGRPIEPGTTLFRVASISKLFTTTAVLQLVEQGRLDLHADVNGYLDFRIEEAFGAPVTLEHLLTHTAGFDDRFFRSTEPLAAPPLPLGRYLAARMPPRVMPPGDRISYSNHGLALAGYLVERVSGEPFADYVRAHVLEPLGMSRSGFGLPDPPPPELAVGYRRVGDRYLPAGVDRLRMAPAGDFYTTALDAARFMLMQLGGGRLGSVRILREDTVREMQRTHFRNHPGLSGWALGFSEKRRGALRTVEHDGSWRGFGSRLVLAPEAQVGLFLSSTRDFDARFVEPIVTGFFERYYAPAPPVKALEAPADAARLRARYAGSYVPNRHVRGDFMKLGLLLEESRLDVDPDGALRFHDAQDRFDPLRLVEVEPGVFAAQREGIRAAFREDASGRVNALFLDTMAYDRVPWYARPRLQAAALAACALLFLATAIGFGLGALSRSLWRGPPAGSPRGARLLALGVALPDAVFLACLAGGLLAVSPFELMERLPGWLRLAACIPLVTVPLSLLLIPWLARAFRGGAFTPLARLHFALLAAASACFAAFAWSWNLLGFAFA
jgi:CubicO group peptidase (beta-lactamase class C family)